MTISRSSPFEHARQDAGQSSAGVALLGRLCMAAIFLVSGCMKIAAPSATAAYIAAAGLPLPEVALVVAVGVELGAGTLLAFGYGSRWASVVLALFCVATAMIFHRSLDDPNQLMHFLKNVAMAGGLLQIAVYGPGVLAFDRR